MRTCRTVASIAFLAASTAGAQELVPVNLYVADITYRGNAIVVGTPRKLTGDRGVSSQPSFTPDGRSVLFIGRRDSANAQSDVYRIDLTTGAETRVTHTAEMENSPTVTPDGKLMVIRWVPATLFREWGPWLYDLQNGTPLEGVLPGPDTVGYYVRVDSTTFAMVRPKNPSAVAIFDTRSKTMTDRDSPVANLPPQVIPGSRAISYTRTDSLGRNVIMRFDLATAKSSRIAPAVRGRVAHVWTPRGSILMGKGNRVLALDPAADSVWREVASFKNPGLQSITTYVVSPSGDKLILISPLKPTLHQLIRDSLQEGMTMAQALAPFAARSPESLRESFEVSRGALTAIANEYKARNAAEGTVMEAFVARLVPGAG
jgi:TolB protein